MSVMQWIIDDNFPPEEERVRQTRDLKKRTGRINGTLDAIKVLAALNGAGYTETKRKKQEGSDRVAGEIVVLSDCPLYPNETHAGAAALYIWANGDVGMVCQGNRCQEQTPTVFDYLEAAEIDVAECYSGEVPQLEVVAEAVEEGGSSPLAVVMRDPGPDTPRSIRWLWKDWLALGLLGIIDGDPSVGKSLIILDIIARGSSGRHMPDGQFAAALADTVFIISTEEDFYYETILPRLHAAGTEFSTQTIRYFEGKRNPTTNEFEMITLPEDTEYIRAVIKEAKRQTGKSNAVFYMDPFVAHLDEKVNLYSDHQLRRALALVGRMARAENTALLAVRHSRKDNPSGKAIHSGGGSVGIGAAARNGAIVTFDPDDDERTPSKKRRILAPYKNTNGPTPDSMAFHITTKPVVMEGGVVEDYACLEWLGTSEFSADELAARDAVSNDGAARATKDILQQLLADGPLKALVIYDTIMNENNVKETAVRYAAGKVGVIKAKETVMHGHWWWALPGHREKLEQITGSEAQAYASNETPKGDDGMSALKYPLTYPQEKLQLALREYRDCCWDRLTTPFTWREQLAPSGWQIVAEYRCGSCGYGWETWHARALLGWVAPALAES